MQSFFLHFRPRSVAAEAASFGNTWHLGFFAVLLFLAELATGLVLLVYYVPTPEGAYDSVVRIDSMVPFGALMRNMHRLCGELLLIAVLLHMVRVFIAGAYHERRRFTWVVGVGLLLLTLALAFSGYLLPWDQRAYWAVTIGASMAETIPVIGRHVILLLRGAPDIGADGLLRFYMLHVLALPLLAMISMAVHYYRVVRLHGISTPLKSGATTGDQISAAPSAQRLKLFPDMIRREICLASLAMVMILIWAGFFYHAPLDMHADPRQTPMNIEAPWFFLWLQGLLKMGDKTLMGVLLPLVLLAALALLPYIDKGPRKRLRQRPLAAAGLVLTVLFLAGFSMLGTHRFGIDLPPAERIFQDLAPELTSGPVHDIPFQDLAVGIYSSDLPDPADMAPALAHFYGRFCDLIKAAETAGEFRQTTAMLVVEDWQVNLKRITLRIIFNPPESANRQTHERMIYISRLRNGDPEASNAG